MHRISRNIVGVVLAALCVSGLATLNADDKKDAPDPVAEANARRQSANNLKQLALGMINYADANGGTLPPAAVVGKDGKPLYSWRVVLLPYIEQEALYKQFKLDEPWDSEHNKPLAGIIPKTFLHPLAKAGEGETFYQVFTGKDASFPAGKKMRFPASFTDGTSNTLMIAEAATAVPWTKPVDLEYDAKKPLPKLGGHFANGFNVALWDGSVQFFKNNFDEKEMQKAITPAGGEVMDFKKLRDR
jgi:hypothetical protein